jgi:hypothetical protein
MPHLHFPSKSFDLGSLLQPLYYERIMASMLERLADELILDIFKHLRPARLLVYLAHDHEVYSAGINSNASVATFASLCLTSKNLSHLAIPELYGNLVKREASKELPYRSSPGQESRSEHYLRRFFEFGEAVVRRPSLGQHLRYVDFSFELSYMLELCPTYLRRERWSSHRKAMKRLALQVRLSYRFESSYASCVRSKLSQYF